MAYLLLTLTVLFWAGNFVVARAFHAEFEPITLALYRWALALLILLPFWLPRARKSWPVIRRYWIRLSLLATIGVAGFNTFLYIGLQTTTALNATLFQSAIPVMILLLSALLLAEKVTVRQWAGVFISLLGVVTIIAKGDVVQLASLQFNSGDIWVLAAVSAWAIYSIALRWRPAELDGFVFLGFTIFVAVLVLLPFSIWEMADKPALQWNSGMLATVGYMAVCPSILSYLFWNCGVAELGAPRAGLFIHLMPMFGMLLSVLFLDEQLFTFHLLGIALIFVGIYLAVVSKALSRIHQQQES